MNKKELVESLLKDKELSKLTAKQIDHVITVLTDTIKKTVKKGEDVTLVGFGTFTKTKKSSRIGVNPNTGERIRIKAKITPKFKPGKPWKEMM